MRKVAVIPTLLTLGNAVCGFASITLASKIGRNDTPLQTDFLFAASGWLIIAAMGFDVLDGFVARLSRSTSMFGLQLDSLCDAISFGLAPAFLLLRLGPDWDPVLPLHQVLAVIATLYMVCAILRLARFNVETAPDPLGGKRFRGLPSPAAAGCIASLAILRGEISLRFPSIDSARVSTLLQAWSVLGAIGVALLMVSRFPYPHLTKQILGGKRSLIHIVQVILGVCVIYLFREVAMALVFWLYALAIPLQSILRRSSMAAKPAPKLGDGISPH
ncbi:MAG TPA: CDP-diacylglycerol--serine O-phosphatidyltransferase [Gemmataceae bacterium]|jgi:CDP-diacylglycerol--serine O-phosphatidyltransferase|nr:CDP-diacylglycerol--serine O-phosphatidyltransferase [Gemmataceae bacterium]